MSRWRPTKEGCLYVIPDIHGGAQLLDNILKRILPLRKKDKIVFLGDYIDRHPDSHLVLDQLIELKEKYGDQIKCLIGNHELMFLQALQAVEVPNPAFADGQLDMWKMNGGLQTLSGYILRANQNKTEVSNDLNVCLGMSRERILDFIPKEHIDFLKNDLEPYYVENDLVFVHGGCHPEQHPSNYSVEVLCWDRSLCKLVLQMIAADEPLPWKNTIITGHNNKGGTPIVKDKFLMLDCSSPHQLLVVEMYSREAFMARPGKRLLKYNLKETKKVLVTKKMGPRVERLR